MCCLSVSENPGSRVLYILQPVLDLAGCPIQDTTAVVQVGGDKGMDESEGRSVEMFMRWNW